ncbi:TOMM precursor leader peptide-binding protein [Haloechinothrix sp. YIM 98757]|uniref:TOMM leader peptide-binding protein n=1 Tax=Haloechinothrix aidingensis TaxID=2752311 RepID=A0A838A7V8_9PSEU|nr:TOMM precursor leader peptide-binding protein [Haloechinothrix aidingensis]MBA0125338.1 TOMM precursor leader peptide-binding protein [Haloechinothrix aidingensis]
MTHGAATRKVVSFKRHLRAEISEGNGAFLFSERGVTVLHGPHIESLATELDGTKDVASLLRSSPGGMDSEQVAALVDRLMDAGLVSLYSPRDLDDDRAVAFWDSCGIEPAGSGAGGAVGSVGLVGTDRNVDLRPTADALRDAGVTVLSGDVHNVLGHADLSVVVCEDYLSPALSGIDAAHREAGQPWLLAKQLGTQVWVGPIFQPGESACWHCLASRLWGHRHAEACAQAALGHPGPARRPEASVPPLAGLATHLVALEATKWLAGHRHQGQRCVWTLDTDDLHGRYHELRARPQCPACGDPSMVAAQARRPVTLGDVGRGVGTGGGYRALTPEQVLDRYRHLVSPVTGVIKEVRRDPRGPASCHSYRSGPNLSLPAGDMDMLRHGLRDESGGKGASSVEAEVGALCEALERYSGSFQGDEERVRASLRELEDQALHPNDCMLFHDRQYRDRAEWNSAHGSLQHVCEPFDEHAVVNWTPVWSLTRHRHRLLPTRMLYYGAPYDPGDAGVRADSNGNAAGSSLEDAILQGLLEIVERDAVALWWYNRTSAPGVDLAAFGDLWVDELRGVYADLGRELWVLDVTSDVGIPVMVALSRRAGASPEHIMVGFGAHLDPRIALRRALTELNQLVPALVEAEPEDLGDPDLRSWWQRATVTAEDYLLADPGVRHRVPADFACVPRRDLAGDVESVTTSLAALGLETLVLDQTRPDIELPVVKVIVPGMRHFWARFGPGRLYDVPVRIGRLSEPTSYEDLNPVPLFL